MESKLTLRTDDEMLAAVRVFQAERRKWFEESDRRLRERVPDEMQSRKKVAHTSKVQATFHFTPL